METEARDIREMLSSLLHLKVMLEWSEKHESSRAVSLRAPTEVKLHRRHCSLNITVNVAVFGDR